MNVLNQSEKNKRDLSEDNHLIFMIPPPQECMEEEDEVIITGFSSKIRFSNKQSSQSHPKPFSLCSFYLGANQLLAVKKKRDKALCYRWQIPFSALLWE